MNLIQCPDEYSLRLADKLDHPTSVFLAGGITSCPLWQDVAVEMFNDSNVVILNPRRKIWNESITPYHQIKWEWDHINIADIVMFWFPCETLCPITLLELGKLLMTPKPIVIGVHPNYARSADIQVQTFLERNELPIYFSLEETVDAVKELL